MTFLFPGQFSGRVQKTPNSLYRFVSNFANSRNAERANLADEIIDILQSKPALTNAIFKRIYMFEMDIVWSMLITLVKRFSFDSNSTTRYSIERTVKETLKQISSLYAPTTLENSSDHERNYKIRRTIIRLLDFVLIEMGRLPSVQIDKYPLNMLEPVLPYMLLFVTSSDTTIQNKAARILHEITSISMIEYAPTLLSVDCAALQADISLRGRSSSQKPRESFSAALNLIGCLSSLFVDADVSSPCVETVKLLLRITSSLLTSKKVVQNVANSLPLTLLVTSLTAAPPSHHLPILNIYLEFCDNCHPIIEVQKPFLTRLFALFPPDSRSDDPLIVALSKLLTKLTSPSSLWETLVDFFITSNHPSRLALSLLAILNNDRMDEARFDIQRKKVPRLALLLLQDLDELSLSFLISLLGQNSDSANGGGLGDDDAQQIVERLLEIEQRRPLHSDTQETEKTTTEGMTQPQHVEEKGEPDVSARIGTNVSVLVDVWRVMRMAVSSLAGSPSGLERLHVLYPLIFLRLKERGNSLLREGRQVESKKDELLLALVRVCSELTPLLRTVDCFPLVHLVSSFLHLIRLPANRRTKRHGHSVPSTLPDCYVRVKEFFLRVDEVTQGLDGYDITHHTIFPRSSTEHSSAGVNSVISRPLALLQFFVDFEVKCIGVRETALLQQNNTTTPDQTRRQLLLHLLSTMRRTKDFNLSAVCEVLLSFPRLPPGTSQLIVSLKNTLRDPDEYYNSPPFDASLPVCAEEACRLFSVLLVRAVPNEADSEERWRVVLREEGSEDMLNVILKQSLSKLGMKIGMNCTITYSLFSPSEIVTIISPPDTPSTLYSLESPPDDDWYDDYWSQEWDGYY
ncbi:hypothetical protein BLNAU_4057 [Blattamonas nauphoetae]|uniref:Uncharacterized protein n=1 Tax=Blattamonas nauphoetae TaxID=2049346 RepID=A0ABQ9YB28_9EUKA|nr:hypothetical protein BLNAU_4057 [Blattamonas nauphoetae]